MATQTLVDGLEKSLAKINAYLSKCSGQGHHAADQFFFTGLFDVFPDDPVEGFQ